MRLRLCGNCTNWSFNRINKCACSTVVTSEAHFYIETDAKEFVVGAGAWKQGRDDIESFFQQITLKASSNYNTNAMSRFRYPIMPIHLNIKYYAQEGNPIILKNKSVMCVRAHSLTPHQINSIQSHPEWCYAWYSRLMWIESIDKNWICYFYHKNKLDYSKKL